MTDLVRLPARERRAPTDAAPGAAAGAGGGTTVGVRASATGARAGGGGRRGSFDDRRGSWGGSRHESFGDRRGSRNRPRASGAVAGVGDGVAASAGHRGRRPGQETGGRGRRGSWGDLERTARELGVILLGRRRLGMTPFVLFFFPVFSFIYYLIFVLNQFSLFLLESVLFLLYDFFYLNQFSFSFIYCMIFFKKIAFGGVLGILTKGDHNNYLL
uniref:Uncharacterized protein n=1 Tax=Oryza brachyantha TaxID=4533 RepID=J3M863_ORYBR